MGGGRELITMPKTFREGEWKIGGTNGRDCSESVIRRFKNANRKSGSGGSEIKVKEGRVQIGSKKRLVKGG